VLLAEMNPQWQPCRIVPFSGGSPGRQAGPTGACTSAAWSPDGKWMYFGAQVSGRRHLWRQSFPDGRPEQITFGSTEEDGIAMASDGRSLITSIFTQQNTVWIHDSRGDRALSTEGYAASTPPVFSADGQRLYYLLRRDSLESPAELWRADPASGKSEVVLPGVSMQEFDLSPDEKDVVYSTLLPGQPSQIWTAPLDRSAAPRRIAANGERYPHFGPNNEILFRMTEGQAYYLGAMSRDGLGRRKVLSVPVLDIAAISPDRLLLSFNIANPPSDPHTAIYSIDGGGLQRFGDGYSTPGWSPDGRYVYVEIEPSSRENPAGKTAAIPIPAGHALPLIPPAAIHQPAEWAKVPGVKIVEHDHISPGPNPSTYAYIQPSVHANLYRIPLR